MHESPTTSRSFTIAGRQNARVLYHENWDPYGGHICKPCQPLELRPTHPKFCIQNSMNLERQTVLIIALLQQRTKLASPRVALRFANVSPLGELGDLGGSSRQRPGEKPVAFAKTRRICNTPVAFGRLPLPTLNSQLSTLNCSPQSAIASRSAIGGWQCSRNTSTGFGSGSALLRRASFWNAVR